MFNNEEKLTMLPQNCGRIETYMHSDSITRNKGGCLVRVLSQTDFAAKTDQFTKFCKKAAQMLYGFKKDTWEKLLKEYPDIEQDRLNLEKELGERITVDQVLIMDLGYKMHDPKCECK